MKNNFISLERIISFIVYRMGRLCGEAHEISGIKAPLFLCGGVGGWRQGGWWWVVGWCGGVYVVGWGGVGGGGGVGGIWGAWCADEGCCGWWRENGWWHG